MEHIELLRGVFTCEQHDRFLAARMVRQEFGDVIHVVTNDDPTIRIRRMLRDGINQQTWQPGNTSPSVNLKGLISYLEQKYNPPTGRASRCICPKFKYLRIICYYWSVPGASPGAARNLVATLWKPPSHQKPFRMLMTSFKNRGRRFQRATCLVHASWVGD